MTNNKTAMLLLEDGRSFTGKAFGHLGETTGEVCFNTGMSGYQEILTDPSYCKQIVTMTAPHIGNYGVNPNDIESDRIQVAGFVIKEETDFPSNWQSTQSIGKYLDEQKTVGIQNVDTRAITRHIRGEGAMNGIISSVDLNLNSLKNKLSKVPSMVGLDLTKEVTTQKSYSWSASKKSTNYKVAAIDYGIKHSILHLLSSYGCDITVFPANTSADAIIKFDPDGIFLSNGPGDPAAVTYGIEMVKGLLGKKPIFGICLGHQILSLALGAKTFKLKFGHRGINHPVRNNETGIVEITSQNHGFAVDLNSLPKNVISTHVSLNDDTSEGIRCTDIQAFSVQYHPESSPGPHDSRYLFQQFIDMMKQ